MRTGRALDAQLIERPSTRVLAAGIAGQSRILTWTGATGPFVELFTVQGSPDVAEALVVTLLQPTHADGTPLTTLNGEFDVEARVTYGVHGFSAEARLDFLSGSRLAVVAGFVRVEARLAGSTAVLIDQQIRVGAMCGYGQGGSSIAQRTLRVMALGAAPATTTFRIPPFAKGVTILLTPVTTAGGYSLTWLDAAGASIGSRDFPTGAAVFGTGPGPESPSEAVQIGARGGLPIPNRAVSLLFTNGGDARNIVNAIFEVQL